MEAGKYLYSRFRTTRFFASPSVPEDSIELVSAGASLAESDPFLPPTGRRAQEIIR